jgi:hypothetical protein
MDKKVMPFDEGRRKTTKKQATELAGDGKVINMSNLSPGVQQKVIVREGIKQRKRFNEIVEMTKGDPALCPTDDQLAAFHREETEY